VSKRIESYLRWLKDVETEFRRNSFVFRGNTLTGDNQAKIASVYTIWVSIIYETLTAYRFGPNHIGGYHRLIKCMESTDVGYLMSCCKLAYDLLCQRMEVGWPDSYEGFKHLLRQNGHPDLTFVGELKGLIVHFFDGFEEDTIGPLMNVLLYPSRVNLELEVLEQESMESYVALEEQLNALPPPSAEEAAVIENWFSRKRLSHFDEYVVPKHGSGSTFEGYMPVAWKYFHFMKTDQLLDYVTRTSKGGYWPIAKPGLDRCARTVFVPKTVLGYRTISMEPVGLMFWQEGVFHAICYYINQGWCGTFGRRYTPETQEHNRMLALKGSIDGSYATIDLSSASDSVRLCHVQQWFRNTVLYKWLIGTRSKYTLLPDGRKLLLSKYAPMGNATTFAVECIIFAAITECAIREEGGDPDKSNYRVYGDDIVVERQYAQAVIRRLERNGFKVNTTKSFYYGATAFFRESCGLFAVNGRRLQPLRCSRQFEDYQRATAGNPIGVTKLVDICNQLFLSDYKLTRAFLIRLLLRLPQAYRPAFGNTYGCLYTTYPDNHQLKRVWDPDLQKFFVKTGRAMGSKHVRCGQADLFEWLRTTWLRQQAGEPVVPNTTAERGHEYFRSIRTDEQTVFTLSFGDSFPND
jgi:hypothetical protein